MCPSTDWPGGSCWREVSRRPGSPVRISPQTLGNRENADQCASPNTRQKNFRRRPQVAPCLVSGLNSEGEELPWGNAMLLSWSGFCGRALLAPLGLAKCAPGLATPRVPAGSAPCGLHTTWARVRSQMEAPRDRPH